jgi:uncharacterized membrane protein
MKETFIIIGLWALFGASHMVLSSRGLRPQLVARLGAGPFMGIYSLVALAVFIPLVSYYLEHRHVGALLWWNTPQGAAMVVFSIAMTIAFILMAAGLITPSPASIGAKVGEPRGAHHLTRHSLFMGTAVWAALHAGLMGYTSDLAFFGGFVVFAVVGCSHQDRRRIADGDEAYAEFVAKTPFLPFTGRNTLRGLREISPIAVVAGVGLSGGARYLHSVLG